VTITDSRFSQFGFVGSGSGGAVEVQLADPVSNTVNITRTVFSNSTTPPYLSKYASGNGGAVSVWVAPGSPGVALVTLANTTIHAADSHVGGGFSVVAGNASVVLSGVNVTDCTSFGVGGGGYVSLSGQYLSAALTVTDSNFVGNAAAPKGDGGALFVTMTGFTTTASSIGITRVTVEGNVATGVCGGGEGRFRGGGLCVFACVCGGGGGCR
jgi:hypothetical protein